MSNIPSDITKENQRIPLVVVHREDNISAVEDEALPSVEEIIPRNPDAKPDH